MQSRRRNTVWIPIIASLALFISSLAMPALVFEEHAPVRGLTTLLWGWWGVMTGDFPWFANPLYFAAIWLALDWKRQAAQICCALAFAIALLSLRVQEWWFNEGSGTPIKQLGLGFYFWIGSFLVLAVLLFWSPEPSQPMKHGSHAKKKPNKSLEPMPRLGGVRSLFWRAKLTGNSRGVAHL